MFFIEQLISCHEKYQFIVEVVVQLVSMWLCSMYNSSDAYSLDNFFFFRFQRADKTRLENESNDCAICLERMENIKYLSCNHAFHRDCLEAKIEVRKFRLKLDVNCDIFELS